MSNRDPLPLKNEMERMVLADLAAICNKLADNSVIREELREEARQLVAEFNSLGVFRGSAHELFEGEKLLIRIAHFLPKVLE